ncbi:single-stranded-DNA-specific exonuclease RecJ [Rhabdochlamydiaceae symbiont of Dictyostelium giganteum]|uniref:single-stranded-DNA-specific exonuclease RecJ n=1 Tax=Rhabdochlamydiaceae symbiont of Dictyostelium giganteum TaxID=3342349 RepID=UPI00385073F5
MRSPPPPLPLWVYPKHDPALVKEIIEAFNIHPIAAQILVSRGFRSMEPIHDFLYAKLPQLHDPDLFPDMDKALHRILRALEHQEKILIYGDNDVDGITGTTLLTEFFTSLGVTVFAYIPNRTHLNHNLIIDALSYATKHACTLMITVDCGITDVSEMREAYHRHIDIIVTDHHEPTGRIAHCIATLNPKLQGSTYPNREITGVGVAFKLAHAIFNRLIEERKIDPDKIDLKESLDLVALGTIADMASLTGENRIFVRYGLKQLRKTKRIGLVKLCQFSDINLPDITSSEVASKITPRINSLGRIADPNKGVKILLSQDPLTAETLAKELNLHNQERRQVEKKNSDDIHAKILENPQFLHKKAIVLSSNQWHPGIIPILATRIAKQYNRPVVVIAIEGNVGKGSLRTIPEFPLLPLLRANKDLLMNFGGHDYAAGLTIAVENIEAFKTRFILSADSVLKEQDIRSKLILDSSISFSDLSFEFMESISLLEPFGNDNPVPIFYSDVKQVWPPKVVGKSHLKFYIDQEGRMLEGIGFGMAYRKVELLKKQLSLHLAFSLHVNTFLNKSSIQLQIRDFKPMNPKIL